MAEAIQSTLKERRIRIHASGWSAYAWPLVAILFAAEITGLRLQFDTDLLIGRNEWWVAPLRLLPFSLQILLCMTAASLVIGRGKLIQAGRELLESEADRGGLRRVFGIHVASLALLFWLFTSLLEGIATLHLPSSIRAGLLLVVGPAWLLSGLALAAPYSQVLGFLSATWRSLLGGFLAGGAAFAAARQFASQDALWEPLSRATIEIAAVLLQAFGQPVFVDRAELVVGTADFSVVVTRFCSGYEGVGLFAIFAAAFGLCARRKLRLGRYATLVLVGAGILWLVNGARIAALIAIGHHISADLALDGFHTHAGWIPLVAAALGLVAIAERHPAVSREVVREEGPTSNPTAAHLSPLLVLLALGLVGGAFAPDPRAVSALRVPVVLFTLFVLRRYRARLLAMPHPVVALMVPLATVGWVLLAKLQGLLIEGGQAASVPAGLDAPLYFGLAFLGYVFVSPLVEELAFRGYLQRRLQDSDFELCPQAKLTWLSVGITALVFGLLHGNLIGGVLFSLLLSGVTALRGRLSDAVFVHVGVNAALVLLAMATGHHELWLGGAR